MTQKSSNKITRDVFRIPVSDDNRVTITIDDQPYKVVNVGSNGVSVLLTEDSFEVNQQLDSIKLDLGEDTFHLSGKIVHISPREFQLICGIEFSNMDDTIGNKFYDFLQKNRKGLFNDE